MNETMTLIAQYIKTNRISMKRTQKEFAEDAGISLMTLRRAENGEVASIETLISIMEIFGELGSFKKLFKIGNDTPRDLVSKKKRQAQRVRKSAVKVEEQVWKWGDDE
jgi:transcriptional regulator with XRE-family HTH domain